MNRLLDQATSFAATLLRIASGMSASSIGPRPAEHLILYEFEACPFCRRVREALTHLDLSAEIRPCPKGGRRFRPECEGRGGKAMFPYLIDPNTGKEMYESEDIVEYLYSQYGAGPVPAFQQGWFPILSGSAASGIRLAKGASVLPSHEPQALLELYSFEASPFCRIVRERLTELELPYVLHNVGKGSPSREAFVARSGKMQVPFLVDPNTDRSLFESDEIVAYLTKTYSAVAKD